MEVKVNFGSTPGAMNERVYVYLNEGETTITYKEGGFYLNEGYATIAAILDWEGYTTDVEPDGKTFRVGKYEKDYNTGIPYVDSSLQPKVTFKYPVKSDVSVTIVWQEESSYGSILCNNYTTVVVKTGQTTAQGTAGLLVISLGLGLATNPSCPFNILLVLIFILTRFNIILLPYRSYRIYAKQSHTT